MKFLSSIYGWIIQYKNRRFDSGDEKQVSFKESFVISVGNLSTGGTGKTPFVIHILKQIYKMNAFSQVLVVSRNYKAESRGINVVNLDNPRASYEYGDEPTLIKEAGQILNMHLDVFVGPVKWKSAYEAVLRKTQLGGKYDFILIDDGFQHRHIVRDLDIVLLDSNHNENHYQLLPAGRLREPLSSLSRADAVVWTKCKAEVSSVEKSLDSEVRKNVSESDLFRSQQTMRFSYRNGRHIDKKSEFHVFCGLAHPEVFLAGVQEQGFKVKSHQFFADHHPYTIEDLLALAQKIKKGDDLITTEKDMVKIKSLLREQRLGSLIKNESFLDGVIVADVEIGFIGKSFQLKDYLKQKI